MNDCRIRDGVERREPGRRADWTVKEDLSVDDRFRCGRGRDLFRPEIRREEETLVRREVVVDGETALTKEHVRRVGQICLQT